MHPQKGRKCTFEIRIFLSAIKNGTKTHQNVSKNEGARHHFCVFTCGASDKLALYPCVAVKRPSKGVLGLMREVSLLP